MSNNLTTRVGVIELMKSSRSEAEWDDNCDLVKTANNGYPAFWYEEILASGLADRVISGLGGRPGIQIHALTSSGWKEV